MKKNFQLANSRPLVSITIPCRNEIKYINHLLNSIIGCDYDKYLIEVFVVDGMSDDGTRELIQSDFLSKYSYIKILDNPNKKTPFAFNIGIKESRGDIIIILGARHIISSNYISGVVQCLLENQEIGCVGGIVKHVYENEISRVISLAMASPFGIGFKNFRSIKNDAFVDTIGSPAFRKPIFDEIGYFDERLTRNQDDDFSYRIKKAGYKIFMKANISIQYTVRANLYNLFKQYRQYGYWKVFVNKKHKTVTTLRQLFPILFLSSITMLILLSFFSSKFIYVLLFEISSYLTLNLFFSSIGNGSNLRIILMQMYTCFVLHISYGLGYLEGFIDFVILRNEPDTKKETLSR